jgi:DNA-binding NarL/FixJ family response regulator
MATRDPPTVRLLLVGEPSLLRDGVSALLRSVDDFVLTGIALNPTEALRVTNELRPDVVVMDAQLPNQDGLAAAEDLVARQGDDAPPVLLLADTAAAGEGLRAAQVGVAGYLLSGEPTATLVAAIRAVAAGDAYLSPPVARQLMDHCRSAAPARPTVDNPLSRRERTVVTLVARGRSNAEIAQDLTLSPSTVKTHVSRILAKLELRDRVQLAAFAHEHHWT